MYISNSSNVGMATLLQQNKNCMKKLTNGGGNIIVGSVVGANTGAQMGSSPATSTVGVVGAGNMTGASSSGNVTSLGGSIMLPQPQTIVFANGVTGASNILSYQQYQNLLQQQQTSMGTGQVLQTTSTTTTTTTTATTAVTAVSAAVTATPSTPSRLFMQQEMVNLPVGSIVTTAGGGGNLTVLAPGNGNNNAQGSFLVAASTAAIATTNHPPTSVSSFQQQFQQQISTSSAQSSHQQQQQHHVLKSGTIGQVARPTTLVGLQQVSNTTTAATTRYFSQFSQQQQQTANSIATTFSTLTSTSTPAVANSNTNRTTHVLVNRSNKTIITSNTNQRLHHPSILKKPPTNTNNSNIRQQQQIVAKSQIFHAAAIQQQQQLQSQLHPQLRKLQPLSQVQRYGASSTLKPQQQEQSNLCSSTSAQIASTGTVKTASVAFVNGDGQLLLTTAASKLSTIASATVPNCSIAQHIAGPAAKRVALDSSSLTITTTTAPATIVSTTILTSTIATATATTSTNLTNSTTSINSTTITTVTETSTPPSTEQETEPEPEIDIVINNVVCSFSVRCHLNLREIALNGVNVEYRRENGMVTMKLRRPYTTASIWSSGRITCTGATSEEQAKIAARRYARLLEKLGFRTHFNNFRVVNVLGTCSMPFAIKIVNFSEKYKKDASYEPELHPGVTYKLRIPKATLKIFSTGSITVTSASVANVQAAIEHIFPLVYEFRKKRSPEELEQLRLKQQHNSTLDSVNVVREVKVDAVADKPLSIRDDVNQPSPHSSCAVVDGSSALKVDSRQDRSPASILNNIKRKRKKLNSGNSEENDEDADDLVDETDNIVVYSEFDDPEDLIEGPDDERDNDL